VIEKTPVAFPKSEFRLEPESKLLFLGSCFAEEIGNKVKTAFLDVEVNPLGICYNPLSIVNHLNRALNQEFFKEEELLLTRGIRVHQDLHSVFNDFEAEAFLNKANEGLTEMHSRLIQSSCIFITLGTSIVFENKNKHVVNNCHKLPSELFNKRFLSLSEMDSALSNVLEKLQQVNPNVKIVFTVSPIRHLRHGASENMRSKARLILLCEKLTQKFEFVSYLPVFEFVMDELRDYRYYKQSDLIHLNDLGVNLVFRNFQEVFFSPALSDLFKRTTEWENMLSHRISHPESMESKKLFERIQSMGRNLIENTPPPISERIEERIRAWRDSLRSR
jgi:hypothetical protein